MKSKGKTAEDEDDEEVVVREEDVKVFGVIVHHSDYLPLGDHNLLHPSVKVISHYLFCSQGVFIAIIFRSC